MEDRTGPSTSSFTCRRGPVLLGLWVLSACGARTLEETESERELAADPTTTRDGDQANGSGLDVERSRSCERGCAWLEECCRVTNRCLPSDCQGNCVSVLESNPSARCLELGQAIVACLTQFTCDELDEGLGSLCATENEAFAEEGCSDQAQGGLVTGVVGEDVPATPNAPTAIPATPASSDDPTGPSDELEPDAVLFASTLASVFDQKCTVSCHEPGGLLGGPGGIDPVMMNLKSDSAYQVLTTQSSVQLPAMPLVGASLENSYLWHKLNDTQLSVGGTGVQMPLVGELSAAELELVRAWILIRQP